MPQFFGFDGFTLLGVKITWEEVITVGAAIAIAVGLRLFLYQTRTGIAMRGVVDNRSLIGLFGGRSTRLSTLSWSIGASLASVAGILVAPRLQLQPLILTLLVIDAYAAAVIGRLRSLPMTFLGALIVGLASSYAVGYVPSTGFWSSTPVQGTLTLSVPTLILFIALLMLPMDRIRSGASPLRHVPLPPASFLRSLQGGVLLVAAVVVAVTFMDPGNVAKLGIGLAFGLICLSLVPLTGWGGYVSICQLTFAGLGAYAMYKFGTGGSLLGLLMAAVLAGGVGRGDLAARTPPAGPLPGPPDHGLRQPHGQCLLPLVGRLRLRRLRPHPPARPLRPRRELGQGVHHLPGRRLRPVLHRPPGPAPGPLRPGPGGRQGLRGGLRHARAVADDHQAGRLHPLGRHGRRGRAPSSRRPRPWPAAPTSRCSRACLILAVVAIGGASVCSGALAGGLAIGFLPANAQDVFIGAGTLALAFYPDGVLPLASARFHHWWSGLTAPRGVPAPAAVEERAGTLAGTRAA